VLLLSAAEVRAALDPDALVDALAAGYAQLSAGAVDAPARTAVTAAGATVLLMGAHRRGGELVTAKLVSLREGDGSDVPTHHAVIVAFDAVSGAPRAVLDGERLAQASIAVQHRHPARVDGVGDRSLGEQIGLGLQHGGAGRIEEVPRHRTTSLGAEGRRLVGR
jgi:1-piperideine-2-carboxylate/1-pyrroline-2-carboxylate reductase [NAD(P)H]